MLKRFNPYILSEELEENQALAMWAWNSHYWVEER